MEEIMILEFVTPRTKTGNRKYLYIDTNAEVYMTSSLHWEQGIVIKSRDYKELIEKLDRLGYTPRIML